MTTRVSLGRSAGSIVVVRLRGLCSSASDLGRMKGGARRLRGLSKGANGTNRELRELRELTV